MYFLTFKVALIVVILGSISLCFGEEMTEEQYRELLKGAIRRDVVPRNPYRVIIIGGKFTPVPGLDNEDAIPFLKKTLKEGLPGTRGPRVAQCYVALCLGKIGDDSVIDDLLAIMNTEDDKDSGGAISEYCVRALGMIGTSKAKEEIYKIFNNDDRIRIGRISIAVLGESINDKSDIYYEILKKISEEHKNDDLRFCAGISIQRINIRIKEKEEKEQKEHSEKE